MLLLLLTFQVTIELYDAITKGDIARAFELIEQHFPALASHDAQISSSVEPMALEYPVDPSHMQYIVFKLRCQQFIEIVRSSNGVDAIQFARKHLQWGHKEYPEMAQEVSSLIAYNDPANSDCGHLLSQERRQQLADEVNAVVLGNVQNTSCADMCLIFL